ncbi:hypothetical protein CO660_00090 [Rhizobium sp. L9]|uniref:hypothetical protein n=1 Tax=Rhizobium sp. L9 TaxID=1340738 RepID=UPI000BE911BF|nr:hypothetical protein [Rhizobium sp. L9]PDT32278.1 hypothetical protein CO660_00090 [Rhizobium sp. L9]
MLNASFRFSPSNIAALKKDLRNRYAHIKSSHLDEAIAASLGFKSYAAMRPVLHEVSKHARLVVNTNHLLLVLRLEELGYRDIAVEELRRLIWKIDFPEALHDDRLEKAIQERRRPAAANG